MSAIETKTIATTIESDCHDAAKAPNVEGWTHYPVTLDNWVDAVHEEKQKTGISYAKIARRIGYARPSLSLALSGNYTGDTKTIGEAYVADRKQVLCPYASITVSRSYCHQHALGQAPTHKPSALRHWRACQYCPHKPEGETL